MIIKQSKIVVFVILLILVVLWNFWIPWALPIYDVLVAVILSMLSIYLNKLL